MENNKTIKIQDLVRKSIERRGGSVPTSNINWRNDKIKTIDNQRVHKISNKIFEAPKIPNNNWFDRAIKYDAIITGGIGDFISVESHLFADKIESLNQVVLATRGANEITKLIKLCYPNLNVINLFNKFPEDRYHFDNWPQLKDYLVATNNPYIKTKTFKTVDFSIAEVFPRIHKNEITPKYSSLMSNNNVDIKKFNLPQFYVSMVTVSNRDPNRDIQNRQMSEEEINCVYNLCKSKSIYLVCVFCNCKNPHPNILHIKDSNIEESIEIVKKSCGYIGVDSCLSVIAGQKFSKENIKIKSTNGHLFDNKRCYYPFCNKPDLFYSNLCDSFAFEI